MRRHLFVLLLLCDAEGERTRSSPVSIKTDLALYTIISSSSSYLLLLLLLHFHLSVSCSNLYISRSRISGQLGKNRRSISPRTYQQLSLFFHHQSLDYFSTGSQSQQSHQQTIDIHNDALPRPIELDKQTASQFFIPHIPHSNS
jgi:hypothetical protein